MPAAKDPEVRGTLRDRIPSLEDYAGCNGMLPLSAIVLPLVALPKNY
jgi:hypothetical protein